MKSMALSAIPNPDNILAVLDQVLPGQREPWLLLATDGDPIAYFNVLTEGTDWEAPYIQADISGRHYNEDDAVVAVLSKIASHVGGRIEHD
jgi:hypothetical protein